MKRHDGLITSVQTFAAPCRSVTGSGPGGAAGLLEHGVEPPATPTGDSPAPQKSLLGDAASALRQSVKALFTRLADN
ncbi:hypothetical protein K7G98_06495 [Saccharothrix sp. MB29]|nr:hypothetical protein [Saccharothrix sp. MB29]